MNHHISLIGATRAKNCACSGWMRMPTSIPTHSRLDVFGMRYTDEMGMRSAMELVDANTHLLVSFNPAFDVRNRTAEVAVDLIASLFGKSTLMRKN